MCVEPQQTTVFCVSKVSGDNLGWKRAVTSSLAGLLGKPTLRDAKASSAPYRELSWLPF